MSHIDPFVLDYILPSYLIAKIKRLYILKDTQFVYFARDGKFRNFYFLRERKRHTARSTASTHYAVLSGGGGLPQSCPGQGWPSPVLSEEECTLGYCTNPTQDWGTPPGTEVPPPQLGLGYSPERTWDQRPGKGPRPLVPPRKALGLEAGKGPGTRDRDWGVPPGMDRQTPVKTILWIYGRWK